MSEDTTVPPAVEPEVTPPGNEPAVESPPPEAPPAKPFTVSVEGADGVVDGPLTITMRRDEPEDAARAAEVRQQFDMAAAHAPAAPVVSSKVALEMEAGRARLAEIASRQTLLDAKRHSEKTEEDGVREATNANKDL